MAVKEWLNEAPGEAEAARPVEIRAFDPRLDVSADAKYIVKNLVLWFLVAPTVFGILAAVAYNALH
jgi:hypothetical protein